MSSSESLKIFLKGKKQRDEETGRAADKQERILGRRSAIEKLFTSIEGWLKSPTEEGIISFERAPYFHSDEQLGMLEEESLKLIVGVSEVFFAPVAGSIAGASARVDMTSGDRRLPIVSLPDRGWHFLVRGPVTRTELVTEESFGDALKELLDE
jgi:hypothetical protein